MVFQGEGMWVSELSEKDISWTWMALSHRLATPTQLKERKQKAHGPSCVTVFFWPLQLPMNIRLQIHSFNLHWCQQLSRRLAVPQPWAGPITDMRPAALLAWVSSALQPTGVHWEAIQSLILWANLINLCVYFLLVLSPENYVRQINITSMCSIKIDMLNMNTKKTENVYVSGLHCNPSTWKTKPGGLSRVWSNWGLYSGAPGYPELKSEGSSQGEREKERREGGWVRALPTPI